MKPILSALSFICVLGPASLMWAQDQPPVPPAENQQQSSPSNGGWRRVDQPPLPPSDAAPPVDAQPAPQDQEGPPPPPSAQRQPAPRPPQATMDPNYSSAPYPGQGYPGQQYPNRPYSNQPYPPANVPQTAIPSKLTIKPGTMVTVRLNQGLSSDRNHVGDGFAATLVQPIVVSGVVVAASGQTVGGRVTEAKKAGMVSGVSHLGLQLTDLTLIDGEPLPVQTQFITRNGPTSVGRDVGAVAGTTAAGAAIGAAADWGRGAAIGAGAGAAAGIIGVLLTRGNPTVLYPEQVLTFRVETPTTLSTEVSPQSFHWASPNDYDHPNDMQARGGPPPRAGYYGPGYGAGYPPPAYPYPYYAYGYPYWGPGFGFYWGPGYYGRGYWGRGYYYGRGYYGRGWRR